MLPLQFLLLTDNTEKIPSNAFCDVGNEAESCAPGFFQMLSLDLDPLAPSVVKPHACCPGYFCPVCNNAGYQLELQLLIAMPMWLCSTCVPQVAQQHCSRMLQGLWFEQSSPAG